MSTDTFDPDFIDRRRAGLENFLLRIAAHYVLGWDEQFVMFLQQDGTWKAPTASNGKCILLLMLHNNYLKYFFIFWAN